MTPVQAEATFSSFLNRTAARVRRVRIGDDFCLAAALVAAMAIPLVVMRSRLHFRNDLLAVLLVVFVAIIGGLLASRRRLHWQEIVGELDLAADERDRLITANEFFTDPDSFKQLAVHQTEQWLNNRAEEIPLRHRWPRTSLLALLLIALMLILWYWTNSWPDPSAANQKNEMSENKPPTPPSSQPQQAKTNTEQESQQAIKNQPNQNNASKSGSQNPQSPQAAGASGSHQQTSGTSPATSGISSAGLTSAENQSHQAKTNAQSSQSNAPLSVSQNSDSTKAARNSGSPKQTPGASPIAGGTTSTGSTSAGNQAQQANPNAGQESQQVSKDQSSQSDASRSVPQKSEAAKAADAADSPQQSSGPSSASGGVNSTESKSIGNQVLHAGANAADTSADGQKPAIAATSGTGSNDQSANNQQSIATGTVGLGQGQTAANSPASTNSGTALGQTDPSNWASSSPSSGILIPGSGGLLPDKSTASATSHANKPPSNIQPIQAAKSQSDGKANSSQEHKGIGEVDDPNASPRAVGAPTTAPMPGGLPDPAELELLPARRRAVVIEYFRARRDPTSAPNIDSNPGGQP